jgi:hypothetical protein
MTSPYHADRPAMQVTAALIALSQKHPSVRPDVEDILFSTPELRGLMQGVCTISDAPTDDPERTLLLFCPEQGGWQTGVFFEGKWLDFATLSVELEPTHFTHLPPDPVEV